MGPQERNTYMPLENPGMSQLYRIGQKCDGGPHPLAVFIVISSPTHDDRPLGPFNSALPHIMGQRLGFHSWQEVAGRDGICGLWLVASER